MLAQELMHINVVKGIKDTIGAKTFMGRASIPIRPFADRPGEPVTDWYDMGKGEWSNDDGTVSHPRHLVPGALQGGHTEVVLHQDVCRSPRACVHCKLCLLHYSSPCSWFERRRQSPAPALRLSVHCSLWQTAERFILLSFRCVQYLGESTGQPSNISLPLMRLHSIKAEADEEVSLPAF